jgi:hypothetical protein
MGDVIIDTKEIDELLAKIEENRKKAKKWHEEGERHVTLALSAHIRLVKDDPKEKECDNKDTEK